MADTPAAAPSDEGSAPPAGRPSWRRLRRAGRWLWRLLLGLTFVVVWTTGWVLSTEAGTRWALEIGLARYDGMIAGGATLDAVRGTILDDLRLDGLVLRDAGGVARVRVAHLNLDWVPAALWAGELPIRLDVRGVRVALGPGGDTGALADLAPPPGESTPPEPPRDAPLNVPVAVEAWIHAADIQITVPDGPPLLDLRHLVLSATAAGSDVAASVHRLSVAAADQEVRALTLAARWDGAEVALDALKLDSSLGQVASSGLTARPEAQTAQVHLLAHASAEALAPLLVANGLKPLPADADLRVTGGGGPEGFGLALALRVGPAADLVVRLSGALLPRPQVELAVDLAGLDPEALGAGLPGGFAGGLSARIEAPPTPLDALASLRPEALTATVHAECHDCRLPPIGGFSVDLDGTLREGAGALAVEAQALGVRAVLEALLDDALGAPDTAPLTASWRITAPSVARAARLGGVQAQGRLRTAGTCTGDLSTLACRGDLHLAGVAAQGVTAQAVGVRFGVAPLAEPPGFDATVRLTAVAAPGAPHPISGTVTAAGTPDAIALTVDATAGPERLATAVYLQPGPPLRLRVARLRATAQGVKVASTGAATVRLDPSGAVHVRGLRLRALDGLIRVDGRFSATGKSDLRAELTHIDLAALRRFVPQPPVAGHLTTAVRLRGRLAAARVDATVDLADFTLDGAPVGDLALRAHLTPTQADAELTLTQSPTRHLTLTAALPVRANLAAGQVEPRLDAPGEITWRAVGLEDAWLAPLAKLPPDVRFAVATHGRLAGRRGRWTAALQAEGSAGAGPLAPAPFTLAVEAGPTRQQVVFDAEVTPPVEHSTPVPVHLSAQTELAIEALATGAALDRTAPMDVQLQIPAIALAPLSGLLPSSLHGLEGTLTTDVQVRGSLAEPQLGGGLVLADGALTVLPLGQRLTGLAGRIALEGRTVRFEDLVFRAAGGRGRLGGEATVQRDMGLSATLGLRLRDLPVLAPGAPPLRVNTRVGLGVQRTADGATAVVITLRETDVELVELAGDGPRPIPSNPNITYVDAAGLAARAEAAAVETAGPPAELDLVLDLADPVRIHGRILDMSWGGRVAAHLGAEPIIEGALKAQGGFVELLGNRFELADGQITLARGASPVPFIRIEATTETDEATVTANIRGNATTPSLEFAAEPALEESQILTLLVTGSTTPSDDERQSVSEQAGALFAQFSSPRFERALQDKLGVDRVRLTFGEGGLETPVLSFGKHLTRRLYVEARYRPNPTETENESELSARFKLRQRWTLESRYGDLGLGDFGVYWDVPLPRD